MLAGGRSSRFGADKALAHLGGRPLILWSLETLRPHVRFLAVSGPRALADRLGVETVADPPDGPRGPLAGVLAGLAWAGRQGCTHLATAPCDTPFLPSDLIPRLADVVGASPVAAARARQAHALCGLWRIDAAPRLAAVVREGKQLSMQAIIAALGGGYAEFEDESGFANVNTTADMAAARRREAEARQRRQTRHSKSSVARRDFA